MKIKIIRNTVANKVPVFEGQVIETSDVDAKYLIGIGKAVKFDETAQPIVETADKKPAAVETTAKAVKK